MGLTYEAEQAQAKSMERESNRRSREYATKKAIKEGVAEGITEALKRINLTEEQKQQLNTPQRENQRTVSSILDSELEYMMLKRFKGFK